jgi:hypothetical protein
VGDLWDPIDGKYFSLEIVKVKFGFDDDETCLWELIKNNLPNQWLEELQHLKVQTKASAHFMCYCGVHGNGSFIMYQEGCCESSFSLGCS